MYFNTVGVQGINHTGLATQKSGCGTRNTKILAHQTWVGHDRGCGCKMQVNNNTISVTGTDTEPAAQQ